jgi:hypothetical protein
VAERLGESKMADRTPDGCAECHQETVRQWTASKHAIGWTNPDFVTESADLTEERCLPCHAPAPLLDQPPLERPRLRDDLRECGVDCNTCHALQSAYAGPYDTWGPHPTKIDRERLRQLPFCGTCHAMEVHEYNALYVDSLEPSEKPRLCAECHMPARVARLTQGHLMSRLHPERIVRDHSFPAYTEEVTRDAVEASEPTLQRGKDHRVDLHFTLTNRGAGHRIPTGEYGHRELRILAELLDSEGRVMGTKERSLFAKRTNGLIPGEPTSFSFSIDLPDQTLPARLRLLVERVNEDRSFRVTLLAYDRPVALVEPGGLAKSVHLPHPD